jgi:heme oxygenase
MLARLDRETEAHGGDVTRSWSRLAYATETSRDEYIRQLVTTYGFEAPYEAACQYTPGLGHAIDLRGRCRSGLIAQDLLALGWKPEEVTQVRCRSTAPFQDPAEALGWMYVVERAMLCHLEARDEIVGRFVDLARACSYLAGYETSVSRRWSELGIAIDRICTSQRIGSRVIEAAKEALSALHEWQRTSEPLLRSVG